MMEDMNRSTEKKYRLNKQWCWSNIEDAKEYMPILQASVEQTLHLKKCHSGQDRGLCYLICTPEQLYPFTITEDWIPYTLEIPFNFKFSSKKNAILSAYYHEDKLKEETGMDIEIDVYYNKRKGKYELHKILGS